MLIPFQPTGTRPAIFAMHGVFGLYTDDPELVHALGPDQPVYGLTAPGFDGSARPYESVEEMAEGYVAEIMRAYPSGRCLITGMCQGGKVTVEVARRLIALGREVGPVLIVDPGSTPYRTPASLAMFERAAANPEARRQLHEQARSALRTQAVRRPTDIYDHDNPPQAERAAHVAMLCGLAISRFVSPPFHGDCELILCSERAPGFFQPGHDWQKALPGKRIIHVIEGGHQELLSTNQHQVHRLVRAYALAQAAAARPVKIAANAG